MTLSRVSSSATTIVEILPADDQETFRVLVEGSWCRLVRLARSVAGAADAEDVVQEALIVAWRKLPALRDRRKLESWVARIVYRRAMRRARRRHPQPSGPAVEPAFTPDPAARVDVWRILSRLAPRQRAVLQLTVVEGMTDAEIGDVLGIAPASVRSHRRRARQRVAGMLNGGES